MSGVEPASGHAARSANSVDTSDNPRIPVLMQMVSALSRATSPHEVLHAFSNRSDELYGPRGYMSVSTRGLPPGYYRVTRLRRLDGSDTLTTADPLLRGDELPVHSGGFFGEIMRSTNAVLVHSLNVPDDPVVGQLLAPYKSLMAIPIFDGGVPINWAIFLRHEPEGFSEVELEQAILRANLVGTAVKNALITNELREAHGRIRAEVEHIASIQRALLPEQLPRIPGLSIAASYEVFDTAGGDYYDFRPLGYSPAIQGPDPYGPWGIIIADASGHGPSAAVLMAMLQSIVHAYPTTPAGPAEMLDHANAQLCSKRIQSTFVTAFMGIYDPVSRRFSYARAGHNPPLLKAVGPGGAISQLEQVGGIPLGVLDDTSYEQTDIELQPGQTILLYTDGITEAMSPDGRMFGMQGILDALATCVGDSASVVRSITGPLTAHEGGQRPNDDQTIVAIQTLPEAA